MELKEICACFVSNSILLCLDFQNLCTLISLKFDWDLDSIYFMFDLWLGQMKCIELLLKFCMAFNLDLDDLLLRFWMTFNSNFDELWLR